MSSPLLHSLGQLDFDNRFVRDLPADPITENYRRKVNNACYSLVNPTPVAQPKLVAVSQEMMHQLDLEKQVGDSQSFLDVFSGNQVLPDMQPYAMCYGGHQFGNWAGQLGDGRAILLGDIVNKNQQRWSLQLKGAGPTPYSRTADGLAVLRSSLREFLCSEAMYHLGVPTTRALSLMLTGETVVRDMFYDGHPQHEPGAVVCRVAPSFTRFGNFQILSAQQDKESLKKLVDYTIKTDFPNLGAPSRETYIEWFNSVCSLTADMIVHWMRVGFVHGVMNTDNMSILGLTIDYGPYGWLEDYDPDWTPNTTDANGRRYRFGHQPQIAQWNLLQLAEAIYPLIEQTEPLEQALQQYSDSFQQDWNRMMAQKLGFDDSGDKQQKLVTGLFELLGLIETDMTLFFRGLAQLELTASDDISDESIHRVFDACWYRSEQVDDQYKAQLKNWLNDYKLVLQSETINDALRAERMNAVNPKYVLRNYLAQQAIDKVDEGDFSMVHELLDVLRKPYDEQPDKQVFAERRPEWARHRAGCSMLSCSS